MMRVIGGKHIIIVQYIIVIIAIMWFLLTLYSYIESKNYNILLLCIFGTFFFAFLGWCYSKLNEVRVSESEIEIRSMLKKEAYNLNEFDQVRRTFLSPFIYSIKLSEQSYFFNQGYIEVLKTIFSFDRKYVHNKIEKVINNIKQPDLV